ncbi:MAG: alginate O-acetyltransferase AlgX-related protein [Planctomycetota bacterium]|jgi:hypothetical protein
MRSSIFITAALMVSCGSDPTVTSGDGGSKDDGSASGGSAMATTEEVRAREGTFDPALTEHLRAIESQAIDVALYEESIRLMDAKDPREIYLLRPPFALAWGDINFQTQFGRSVDPDAPLDFLDLPAAGRAARSVVDADRALDARGIDFLVVPIPRTPQIYPERLLDGLEVPEDFVGVDPGTAAFLAELDARGVEVLHLTPHFAQAREVDASDRHRYLFHDENAHWTPRAASLTADLIAERIAALPNFEPGDLTEGRDWFIERIEATMKVPFPGHRPRTTTIHVDAVVDEAGDRALVRSSDAPILLLGDSNCGWYSDFNANFADQLFARLGQSLDAVIPQGPDARTAWNAVLRRTDRGLLEDKRIVVWVFDSGKLGQGEMVPTLFEE